MVLEGFFGKEEETPEFSLTSSRYDMSTYSGRLKYFMSITDPRMLVYSDKEILEAKTVLEQFKSTGMSCGTAEQMWTYRKIVDSSIHPGSGEIIFPAFRVSAIAPVNIPLVFAMIACPASNVPGTLFLHWANQSYNTACNYANRSGRSMAMEDLAKAYGLAVSSACAFAYGLGRVVQRYPNRFLKFGVLVPCIATAAANVSNVGFTRIDEIINGAPVMDPNGEQVGLSKIAGLNAVGQTALTRCVLVPCSVLLLPAIIMSGLRKISLVPRNARAVMGVEILVIYACLQAALPAALALYPQTTTYEPSELEPQFHFLTDKNGNPIKRLTANKGL